MSAPTESRASLHQHPIYRLEARMLTVAAVTDLTPTIRQVTFTDPTGRPLPSHEPGAHVVVTTHPGTERQSRNAYSLTGEGVLPRDYRISVLRKGAEDGGRGGSEWVHTLGVGDLVEIEGPRSHFAPRHDQRHALLVAGGIGITPILSHARALRRWSGTAEVLYAHRAGFGAHLDDLAELGRSPGITVHLATGESEMLDLMTARFADQPLGTHAYACGPAGLLETYQQVGLGAGWPADRLHLERFAAPELDPGAPFTATVRSTGTRLDVAPGVSLLTALLEAGVAVPNLCRQGVCGECLIPVRSGEVEHRDFVLSEDERAVGDRMLCCVSRGVENVELEVDL